MTWACGICMCVLVCMCVCVCVFVCMDYELLTGYQKSKVVNVLPVWKEISKTPTAPMLTLEYSMLLTIQNPILPCPAGTLRR